MLISSKFLPCLASKQKAQTSLVSRRHMFSTWPHVLSKI